MENHPLKEYTRFRESPLDFVLTAYPWGKDGTFLAMNQDGSMPQPEDWQIDILETIGEEIRRRDATPEAAFAAIKIAVASGHGIGKTTLVAWLIDWFICCFSNPQVVVTAGTAAQLEKKTWRELAKWHKVSLHKDWFEWTATKYYLKEDPETWFAAAIPWSEHRADAFAGTHEKYVLVVFDEASAIADIIWETVEGAMTTAFCIWVAFGNPIRNTGRFKMCFSKFRKYWICKKVDSRSTKIANKVQIQQWLEQYGEDSDFFRKRVRGEFPHQSSNQLIPEENVMACREWTAAAYEIFPIRITCDVARFGEDSTVIMVVQGRKVLECIEMHGKDTVKTYSKLMECFNFWKQKTERVAIYVDDVGVGGGVTDMLRHAHLGIPIFAVNSGGKAKDETLFINMRIEMWWDMAEAIKDCIDMTALSREHFDRLKDDLVNIEYFMQPKSQKYQLESVDDLKERSMPSPDFGTALALSFAYPVPNVVQSSTSKFEKMNKKESSSITMAKKRGRNGIRKGTNRR